MRRVATLLWLGVFGGCSAQAVPAAPEKPKPDAGEQPGDKPGDKPVDENTKPDNGNGTRTDPTTSVSSNIGINLSAVNYYATQFPFSNLFLNRDRWMSTDGMTWDTEMASSIPADADGYALELPAEGQMFQASAFLPIRPDTFVLTWKGDGELTVQPEVKVLDWQENSITFNVPSAREEALFLRIARSNPEDHIRAIEIHGQKQDYGADFRASLQGFGVLRFMDWGATNNSPVVHWSDRTTPNQAQGTEHGVAIEHMVDTANAVHADMWFNVPHKADDDYVQRAAQLIADRLDKKLKVYVEYSNENWNGIFTQVQWEQKQGLAAGLDKLGMYDTDEAAEFWAGMNFAVRRAGFIHGVFRKVLGDRVVRVLAGQSANAGLNEEILTAYEDERVNPSGGKVDALAVAPYFGRIYGEPEEGASLTVARILSDADASIEELVAKDTRENRSVANAHGVHLIAYEAGQHVLLSGELQKQDQLVQYTIQANRDPRMGDLYRKAHRAWLDAGGELAVYFSSCEPAGKYGSWGALEYQDQPPSEAPKWAALRAIMQK